jgi:hypothetical protein
MAQHIQACQSLWQYRLDLYCITIGLSFNRVSEIDLLPVYARSQRLLRQVAVELLQSFRNRDRRRHLRRRAIIKLDVNVAHLLA